MFLLGDLFLRTLLGVRTCWFAGRFGGGKTLLSFAVADWLFQGGVTNWTYSNIPSVWCDEIPDSGLARDWNEGEGRWKANCSVIFDESWILLDAREWNKNIGRTMGAFLRKFNVYLLLPSVFPVDVRFRSLTVQRMINGFAFGIPLYVYRWQLGLGYISEGGYFGLWRPQQYFGVYDHLACPSDDGGLLRAMGQTVEFVEAATEYTGEVQGYEGLERARERAEDKRQRVRRRR
jgi:hypothetical protein